MISKAQRSCLLLIAVLSFPVVDAQEHPLRTPSIEVSQYRINPDRTASLETEAGRDSLVAAVERYCEVLRFLVPRNDPGEQDWLIRERDSGDPDRIDAAARSVEWARSRIREFTDECLRTSAAYLGWQIDGHEVTRLKSEYLIELGRIFSTQYVFADEVSGLVGRDVLPVHTTTTRDAIDVLLLAAVRSVRALRQDSRE